MVSRPEVLLDGLIFPEGPRWYAGSLWLSDMHAHRVVTVDLTGAQEVVAEFNDKPSGLGFLRDGTPIVVLMRRKLLARIHRNGDSSTYANLSEIGGDGLNDMLIDGHDHAYVGNRLFDRDKRSAEGLILVRPDGTATQVADMMGAPNGLAVTPDGRTLIVAESRASKLTMFDILDDGLLSGRRLFADTGDANPDGIALDAEGGVWFGSPRRSSFLRMLQTGEVTDEIKLPEGKWAVACALGGPDRRTLFMLTVWETMENLRSLLDYESESRSSSKGFVEIARVEVPGAGWP